MDLRVNITIPRLNKLISNSIIGLLIGTIGVLTIHQNSISNIFNYIIICYIIVVLTICSTLSLIKENNISSKKYSLFVFTILLYNVFISFLLIVFLIIIYVSNKLNDIIINLLITFLGLLECFLYSFYNIRKVYIFYKLQNYDNNENNRLLN